MADLETAPEFSNTDTSEYVGILDASREPNARAQLFESAIGACSRPLRQSNWLENWKRFPPLMARLRELVMDLLVGLDGIPRRVVRLISDDTAQFSSDSQTPGESKAIILVHCHGLRYMFKFNGPLRE